MSAPVDRALVERLLDDPSLSYREIARRANCSDWSVRAIARGLEVGGEKHVPTEPLTALNWAAIIGIVAAIFGGIWLLSGRYPPLDGTM